MKLSWYTLTKSTNTVHYVMTTLNKRQFYVIRKSNCNFRKIHTFTKTFLHFFMTRLSFLPLHVHTKKYRQIQNNGKQGFVVQYLPDQIVWGIGSKYGFQQVPIRSVSGPQHFRSINIAKIRQQRAQACNLKKVISQLGVLCIHWVKNWCISLINKKICKRFHLVCELCAILLFPKYNFLQFLES